MDTFNYDTQTSLDDMDIMQQNNNSISNSIKEFISNKRNVMYLTAIIIVIAAGYLSYDYYKKNYLNKTEKENVIENMDSELIHEGRVQVQQPVFELEQKKQKDNEPDSEMFQDINIEHMEPSISDYEPNITKDHNLSNLEINNIIQQLDQSNMVSMPMYN